MKKIGLIGIICCGLLLSACNKKESAESPIESSIVKTTATTSSTTSETAKEKKVTELNETGSIGKKGKVMYQLEATKVLDVTKKVSSELINDTNYLDYYSNGQGKQAVEITLKMTNLSDKTLGMPFLDGVKVTDEDGISSLGGWKNESGGKTEFGYMETDANGKSIDGKYEIKPGETKLATSTVLLATKSNKVKFDFYSSVFKDNIIFELPIAK